MNADIVQSKSGLPTLLIDGRYVHSRYQPETEAHRFAESRSLTESTRLAVVIGDGLGFISRAMATRNPKTRVFGLCLSQPQPLPTHEQVRLWWDGGDDLIRTFLTYAHPLDSQAIEFVVWQAGVSAAPQWFDKAKSLLSQAIVSLHSELATISRLGTMWIGNAIRRTLSRAHRLTMTAQTEDVVMIAAGPGAETALPLVSRQIESLPGGCRPLIVVVSSAHQGVASRGINPDILVHTDAGYWSKRYLRSLDRSRRRPYAVATTTRAVRIPSGNPPYLFTTNWVGDRLFPDAPDFPVIAEAPSVVLSAVAVARLIAPMARIWLIGADLCSKGWLDHLRPHQLDRHMNSSNRRLRSLATMRFERTQRAGQRVGFWPTGEPAYQTQALRAFQPFVRELAHNNLHVISQAPVWEDPNNLSQQLRNVLARLNDRCTSGTGDRILLRTVERPQLATRAHHARAVLNRWRDQLADFPGGDRTAEDLVVHFAAPDVIERYVPATDAGRAMSTARDTIDRLLARFDLEN